MEFLTALWLPILVTTIAVHLASVVVWMFLPHHRNDWARLDKEDEVMDGLREAGVTAGQYMLPCPDTPEKMRDPEFQQKMAEGPSGLLVIMPKGPLKMGGKIGLTLLHHFGIAIFVGYLTYQALGPGAAYLDVFQIAGTATILAYCGALFPNSIWFWRSWSMTFKQTLDGVAYGLIAAGIFGALWP